MKKITFFLFICLSTLASAQAPIDSLQELQKTYQDYFKLNREHVYLQLNKTKILPGENIWFSAYVFDARTQQPNLKTTNLHVNLYSHTGKLLKAKTLFIRNGKGEGYFNLKKLELKPGNYLIRAFTRYMANFKEEMAFSQGFKILGKTQQKTAKTEYDLQLLPEGGHILVGVPNTIGVKLINNAGLGVSFIEGKVLNAKGKVITSFASNQFGLGKFTFHYKPKHTYRVEVKLANGKTLQTKIQEVKKQGVTFAVNTLVPNYVYIVLYTNKQSIPQVAGEQFYLAIHQAGIIQTIPFIFPQNKTKTLLKIDKSSLADGVNVLTVFNENYTPILERSIFYGKHIKREHISAKLIKNRGDSIFIGLNSELKQPRNHLSISVLPAKTKAYTPKNDILSAFYIEPFIKGDLENGSYYFSKGKQQQKAYNLDLLFLTQGWSKYQWHNIFQRPPQEKFQAEHGFSLLGTVTENINDSENTVLVKSDKLGIFRIVPLDYKNNFSINNLFLYDNAPISIGLINGKRKNNNISELRANVRVIPKTDTKPFYKIDQGYFTSLTTQQLKSPNDDSEIKQQDRINNFIKDDILLNKVIVETENLTDAERKELHYNDTHALSEIWVVDKKMTQKYFSVLDFIESQGYIVEKARGTVKIQAIIPNFKRGSHSPLIILDGMQLNRPSAMKGSQMKFALTPLYSMQMSTVKKIIINDIGSRYGVDGAEGVIKIFTKDAMDYINGNSPDKNLNTMKLKNGFSQPKEFYAPKYRNYHTNTYAYYGVIDWFPHLQINPQKDRKTLKLYNTGQDHLKLFIQGMTADGSLISEVLTVPTHTAQSSL